MAAVGVDSADKNDDGENDVGERDDGERRCRGERSAREREGNRTNNPLLLEGFIMQVYTLLIRQTD